MARTVTKQRRRELKHDKFRDTTTSFFEHLGNRLEGQGRTILYALGALVAVLVLFILFSAYNRSQSEKARAALGRAIDIANVQVAAAPAPTPAPNSTLPVFTSERERAERAVREFEAVANDYGSPQSDIARYLAATYRLTLDREQAIKELQDLTNNSNDEVAANAKFALAQARETDAQYDAAANLYRELINDDDRVQAVETLNLRLASVYEKQGKRNEAVDLLFGIVKESRQRKKADGKPAAPSAASREAAEKLQELDAARYAQLPPEPPAANPYL
ncbi:MAG: hypothetical protein MSG64_03590 [Pyrinomonadaceae bacterium MAG19_C2-C3]|nr:hypothetical protein [Pyrinomonadaceae bacterium MAG19_C2-C3]